MPDADKIGTLSRRWSKMYRKVCEGYFSNEQLADDAMRSLVKDIGDYGDHPIRLLKEAAIRLEGIRNTPLFRSFYNWNDEDRFIRELASSYMQRHRANHRGIDIAISVYKGLINKLRNGESVAGNSEEALCRNYIRRIYDSNFAERIPLISNSDIDLDWNLIGQRLNEITHLVNENIASLAPRIAQKGNVKRIKPVSRQRPRKPITLEDDISQIGSSL
jgi:hypothetical protein